MQTVVIVGAGFGGLACAKALANRPFRVVLIDRNNYHLFTPLLYQVASSLLNPSDIAYPVRSVFRGAANIEFRTAEIVRIDVAGRAVHTADGGVVSYDALVIATGAAINFFGQDELERAAFHLQTLPRALELRNHVLECFESAALAADAEHRRRLLTFVIVGAGPTGVEYAGALAELVRLIVRRDYPLGPGEVRIVLLEGAERVLPPFPEPLGEHARRRLARLGVDVRVGTLVRQVAGDVVTLADGSTLEAHTLVWAAGVRARAVDAGAGLARRGSGRIEVDEFLRVAGADAVFAIGDAAGCIEDGRELPMLSAPAMQQGRAVAANLRRAVAGKATRPFRYRDKGIMATIGRHAGVAQLGKVRLKGWIGWVSWLVVHLYFIIGFRNRIAVLLRWAWNYIFYDRPIRFVFRAARRDERNE